MKPQTVRKHRRRAIQVIFSVFHQDTVRREIHWLRVKTGQFSQTGRVSLWDKQQQLTFWPCPWSICSETIHKLTDSDTRFLPSILTRLPSQSSQLIPLPIRFPICSSQAISSNNKFISCSQPPLPGQFHVNSCEYEPPNRETGLLPLPRETWQSQFKTTGIPVFLKENRNKTRTASRFSCSFCGPRICFPPPKKKEEGKNMTTHKCYGKTFKTFRCQQKSKPEKTIFVICTIQGQRSHFCWEFSRTNWGWRISQKHNYAEDESTCDTFNDSCSAEMNVKMNMSRYLTPQAVLANCSMPEARKTL